MMQIHAPFWSSSGAATDPYFSNVILLLHCDGADGSTTIEDSSQFARTGTGNSNIKLSTTRSKFGTASLKVTRQDPNGDLFGGAQGDFARTLNQPWTMEAFVWVVNSLNFGNAPTIVSWIDSTPDGDFINVFGTTPKIDFTATGGGAPPAATTINKNEWVHVASTFDGTNVRVFIGGALIGTYTRNINLSSTATLYVGGFTAAPGAGDSTEVYIDEVRFTKGVARYTATFTPPTEAFPDQ
jgi:hypothetical protein